MIWTIGSFLFETLIIFELRFRANFEQQNFGVPNEITLWALEPFPWLKFISKLVRIAKTPPSEWPVRIRGFEKSPSWLMVDMISFRRILYRSRNPRWILNFEPKNFVSVGFRSKSQSKNMHSVKWLSFMTHQDPSIHEYFFVSQEMLQWFHHRSVESSENIQNS